MINPITFKYNGKAGFTDTKTTNFGVIAQDILPIAPYTIGTFKAKLNADDPADTELYNFNSGALTFVTINAIKEQHAAITNCNDQISNLIQQTDADITHNQQLQTAVNTQREAVQASLTALTASDMKQKEKIAHLITLTTTLQQQIQELQDILIKNSMLPQQIKKP